MTQTDSIKLAFLLAIATVIAAFALAGASDTVLYDGMTCVLVQGNGTEGLQCQELDKQGNMIRGMSIACGGEYDGLCQEAKTAGDSGSPAQAGATCRSVGNGGLECQDNATGAWFSTTCDLSPELCAQTTPQEPTGCAQNYCPLPKKDSDFGDSGSQKSPLMPIDGDHAPANGDLASHQESSSGQNASLNLDPQLRDPGAWEELSEGDLLQANDTLNKFIAENSGRLSSKAKSPLSALQGTIHRAYAHLVSQRIIGAIGEEYRSRDGIYERPKPIKIEGILTADTVVAQLLRDVTLWEECRRQVRHVDMLKQCADTPFGQSRLFRY